jgi:hypothetical protein
LVAVDRSFPSGSLELDGRLDQRFVRGFAPPAADADRTTTPGATVRLPGFGAQAPHIFVVDEGQFIRAESTDLLTQKAPAFARRRFLF